MTTDDLLPPRHPRNAVRYRVVAGAVAVQGAKLGQIIDISRSGLAFQYIAPEEDEAFNPEPLRIICNHELFSLAGIASHEVYDRELSQGITFSFLKMRRRGLLFLGLGPQQQEALNHFLATHTRGPA